MTYAEKSAACLCILNFILQTGSKQHYAVSVDEYETIRLIDTENLFDRLKVEMFYDENLVNVNTFIEKLKNYIDYYNNHRISLKLKGISPVKYRTHSI